MNLEEERDALRRELTGTQEMLAYTLKVMGDVTLPKAVLDEGLSPDTNIFVEEHPDRFVIGLSYGE